MTGKTIGLGRADLAILAANVGALGIVANIGGMKIFETSDVRIPVAVYAIGALLALLAILIAYASSQRRTVKKRRSARSKILPWLSEAWQNPKGAGNRQNTAITAPIAATSAPSPKSRGPASRQARIAARRTLARERWQSSQRALHRKNCLILALCGLSLVFTCLVIFALRNLENVAAARIGLAGAATTAIFLVLCLSRLSRLDRRRMRAWADRLSLGSFTALVLGTTLLLAPTISDGATVLVHKWEPPSPPANHDDWLTEMRMQTNQSRWVEQTILVQNQTAPDTITGPECSTHACRTPTPCPAVTPCAPPEVIPVPPACEPQCFSDKPYDPPACKRCVAEATADR